MKKQVALLMAVVLLLSCFAFPAFAVEPAEDKIPIPAALNDADEEIHITVGPVESIPTRGYVLSLQKPVVVSNSDYEEACRLTLIARFLVNDNNTITCISSLYETKISINGWAIEEAVTSSSDHGTYSVATVHAYARKRLLGILTKNIPLTITITAYSDGSYD